MNDMLNKLVSAQQTLERAESSDDVIQALSDSLALQVKGGWFEVRLEVDGLSSDEPKMESGGATVTVPLRCEGQTFGLLTGRKAEAFAQTELAFVLSQSSIASARLARQIALAVEVSDLNEQALVANRLKSEFFTTISHELRTPLNAILGYTELMVAGRYGPLSDQQQDRLGRVFENAQHLLALIDDVLALSRIEAGKMKPDLQVQDIAPFIRAAVGRITSEAEQKQLSVTLVLPDSLPSVLVDSEQIRQIMT